MTSGQDETTIGRDTKKTVDEAEKKMKNYPVVLAILLMCTTEQNGLAM